jgi:hypothetical protein
MWIIIAIIIHIGYIVKGGNPGSPPILGGDKGVVSGKSAGSIL